MKLTEINIYPIKSMGGISLEKSSLTLRGLDFDRRWMLIDEQNKFQTQREMPKMALFRLEINPPFLEIFHKNQPSARLKVPLKPNWKELEPARVTTWDWTGQARLCGKESAEFFSNLLKNNLRLVYMPASTRRQIDPKYAEKGQFTSFSDGFSFLIIGQKSLDELNARLREKGSDAVPMNRFRTNFVFDGMAAMPFIEDTFEHFSIGKALFHAPKPCARCIMPTIDQSNSIQGKEPIRTMAGFRFKNNKIYFGQNLLWLGGESMVHLGDILEVSKFKAPVM